MEFDKIVDALLNEVSENAKSNLNLTIGKYKLIHDYPGDIYKFAAAPLSSATKKNLEYLVKAFSHRGKSVTLGDVYIIDKSGGRGVRSYYITGKIDSKPFVWARTETASRQSGQTNIYFEDKKVNGSAFLDSLPLESTTITDIDGAPLYVKTFRNTTEYYKDPEMTILHRKGGPARISQGVEEFFLDGVEYMYREGFDVATGKIPIEQVRVKDIDGSYIYKLKSDDDPSQKYCTDLTGRILHRLGGPSQIYPDYPDVYYYYINGKHINDKSTFDIQPEVIAARAGLPPEDIKSVVDMLNI